MCNHYIPSTACPQALGSLRHFIFPNLQFQHFKDLKPCWHWTACRVQPPAAPRKGVEKLPYSTYISLSNPYKSSSCCRGQLQAQLLGGTEINASCWEGSSACEHPRGERLQGSVGPAAVGQLDLTAGSLEAESRDHSHQHHPLPCFSLKQSCWRRQLQSLIRWHSFSASPG